MIEGKYFTSAELRCPHCGAHGVTQALVDKLDELRELCGFSLPVASGYRCPQHPREVAKLSTSGAHVLGLAADLHVFGGRALAVLRIALSLSFTGVGLSQRGEAAGRFIHLDIADAGEGRPRPHLWSY